MKINWGIPADLLGAEPEPARPTKGIDWDATVKDRDWLLTLRGRPSADQWQRAAFAVADELEAERREHRATLDLIARALDAGRQASA